MGRVIPPGLVAEDCVIPAKANAAMGTWFPYLLKGIEPSRFEAVRAGLTGRGGRDWRFLRYAAGGEKDFFGIYWVAPSGATFFVFRGLDEREVAMERKCVERELKQRIQTGTIRREDVTRRLAELAFGKANDCVRLALEDEPKLDKLDLSLLSEVKRNDKGTVEIKLIDRLQALEQLATVADGERTDMDDFLKALQGGGEE